MAAVVIVCNFGLFKVHLFLLSAVFNADLNDVVCQGTATPKRLFVKDGGDKHDL
jgi:hypothetical protein